MSEVSTAPRLKRNLSFFDIVTYGLLYFVPIAPVAVFGAVFDLSHGMAAATYILGGLAMCFSALSYSEMARRIPLSGSVYSYVSKGAGPGFGFLAGWALLLDYLLFPALAAILAAASLAPLFPAVPRPVWLALFVFLPCAVNLFGITVNVKVGKALLAIQLAVIFLFLAFAVLPVFQGKVNGVQLMAPVFDSRGFSLGALFAAVPVAALSYLGFDVVSTLNEEAQGAGAAVSRATMLLLLIVTLLFVAQVYLAAIFVPAGTRFGAHADVAFYLVSARVVGAWFLPLITLTNAFIALLANALIAQAATAKVIFCMARDGSLPRFLHQVNRHSVPSRALLLVAAMSVMISLLTMHRIETMVTMVTFGALSAYVMLHLAVIRFFHARSDRRIFAHVISPILGTAVLGYALVEANINAKILGLSWLLVGVGLALFLRRRAAMALPLADLG
ncbi:MAG: APC family permease [Rhizomicrobium sp.]